MTLSPAKSSAFIGCGVVVRDNTDAILLVMEGDGPAAGRWSLPAGKLEPGETLVAAAVREAREETGLVVDIEDLLGVYHSPVTTEGSFGVNFVFRARQVGGRLETSVDHPDVRFASRAEIDALLDEGRFRSGRLIATIMTDLDEQRSLPADWVATMAVDPTRPAS